MTEKTHSIFDLVTWNRAEGPLVEEGDCGIVLKPNGSFQVFSTGADKLGDDPANWGEREQVLLANGRKLMALTVALSNEQVMHILYDLVDGMIDPDQIRTKQN